MSKISRLCLYCMLLMCSQVSSQTLSILEDSTGNGGSLKNPVLKLAGPPWEPFLSEQEPTTGLATEIVVRGLKKAGYQITVSILPWRRVLAEAKNNSVDILIGLWKTAEREKIFSFSEPYYKNQIHFIGTNDKSLNYFSNIKEMKGQRIGLRKGASYGLAFDNASELNKVFVPNSLSMLRMLVLERLDYGIGDRLILNGLMKNNAELNGKLVFIEPEVASLPLHMAVVKARNDHRKIVESFNLALKSMQEQGELMAIYNRYGVE